MTTSVTDLANLSCEFERKAKELNQLKNCQQANLFEFCRKQGFHSPFNARKADNFQRYLLKSSQGKENK